MWGTGRGVTGKTTSLILEEWHVDRSSATSESKRTRYVEHAAVAAKKSCPPPHLT